MSLKEFFLSRISMGSLLRDLVDRKYLASLDDGGGRSELEEIGDIIEIRRSFSNPKIKHIDIFIQQTSGALPGKLARLVFEPAKDPLGFLSQLLIDSCDSHLLLVSLLKRNQVPSEILEKEYLDSIRQVDVFISLARGKVVAVRLDL